MKSPISGGEMNFMNKKQINIEDTDKEVKPSQPINYVKPYAPALSPHTPLKDENFPDTD